MAKKTLVHNGKTYKLISFRKTKSIADKFVQRRKKSDKSLEPDLKYSYKVVPHQGIYLVYSHSTYTKKFMNEMNKFVKSMKK